MLCSDLGMAKLLRTLRNEQGLTIDELAKRANSERSRISRAERDYQRLRADELRRIARVLGVEVGDIVPPCGGTVR